jgi:hypothetical protein
MEDAMSELSGDAKALIERARLDDAPSAEDKQRIRARLVAQLGAGAFASAAVLGAGSALEAAPSAGKASSLLQSTVMRWVAGSLVASGLAIGGFQLAAPRASKLAPAARSEPVAPTASVEPASVEPASVEPAVPLAVEPAHEPPAARKHAQRARKRAVAPSFAPVGSSSTLSAEIALLSQAQKALRARDGRAALRLAQQHAEYFPNGALYEERIGIEAIAHCLLGEREHPAVRAFLARSPRSPLSARVRKECE